MSKLNLPVIYKALGEYLRELDPGIYVYDLWPGDPKQVPCIVIMPPDSTNLQMTAQRGMDMATIPLLCIVGRVSPTAQAVLLRLMSGAGQGSIANHIYANRKLGGVVDAIKVPSIASGTYVVSKGSDSLIGCEVRLEIYA